VKKEKISEPMTYNRHKFSHPNTFILIDTLREFFSVSFNSQKRLTVFMQQKFASQKISKGAQKP
jgi:hypothetical protein